MAAQAHPAVTSPEGNADAPQQGASYQVLLTILLKLQGTPAQERLLRTRPEATAIPFLVWAAEQEAAAAPGQVKQSLTNLCERLVLLRQSLDDEGMDALYLRTLERLTAGGGTSLGDSGGPKGLMTAGGSTVSTEAAVEAEAANDKAPAALERSAAALAVRRKEEQVALLADPTRYAVRLAEAVTGAPLVTTGFTPLMDVLLQVAPPAALTAEGVRQGHDRALQLGGELKERRQRSVSSIIGRVSLTPQQMDTLAAGSAASRILDMLLALPSSADRIASLPDCFTPPPAADGEDVPSYVESDSPLGEGATSSASGAHVGSYATGFASTSSVRASEAAAASSSDEGGDDVDVLWCMPSQLLNEIDSRVAAIKGKPRAGGGGGRAAGGAGGAGGTTQRTLGAGPGQLVGEPLLREMQTLRSAVEQQWLLSLGPVGR